jgi:2-polyprenyl-3-methyl-5-hydroxy-6-metoxy-1,4-benzoquinol methylase
LSKENRESAILFIDTALLQVIRDNFYIVREHDMKVTRGSGFLEGFLAKQRANKATQLISEQLRGGSILDIGCGSHPYFLLSTEFANKYGLDKTLHGKIVHDGVSQVTVNNFDVEQDDTLPHADESFDVVTMLAVIEHIEPVKLTKLLADIYRIMRCGGEFIITTPTYWTDGLLRVLAGVNVLSKEEIDEHKDTYSHAKLSTLLVNAGFSKENIRLGYFEMCMNLWGKVTK